MAQSPAQQVADLHALLDSMSLDTYDDMAGPECAALATSLMRATARVKAHELAAVLSVENSDEARRQGATSTGSLLAGSFGGDRRAGDRMAKQADRIAKATRPRAHSRRVRCRWCRPS